MRREPADCSKPLARVFAAEEKAASATPPLNLLVHFSYFMPMQISASCIA